MHAPFYKNELGISNETQKTHLNVVLMIVNVFIPPPLNLLARCTNLLLLYFARNTKAQ